MAMVDGGAGGMVPMFGGRCVGGTTTMNTKVSFRAHDFEFAKWHEASGLLGAGGKPFGTDDLAPITSGSSATSASASAPTGPSACAPSTAASASWERSSSRSTPTRTTTA